MLDFNHGANRPAYSINETTLQINRLVNAGLERESANATPRSYLGASQIGEPCLRKIQYGYRNSNGKGFDGKTLPIIERPHDGFPVHGVLGADLLMRCRVTIDRGWVVLTRRKKQN